MPNELLGSLLATASIHEGKLLCCSRGLIVVVVPAAEENNVIKPETGLLFNCFRSPSIINHRGRVGREKKGNDD